MNFPTVGVLRKGGGDSPGNLLLGACRAGSYTAPHERHEKQLRAVVMA